ncbi:hypothetical protein DRE_02290 [Drechslerella stenobrocha 248]|uniref:Translation initiation factor 3 C-terminal domain-containing protein n=1 Tax=Drechslerella stenobrocha 248 TaxID=1043628 RepID=W7HVH9_9PEZI|nr:hypothetical protein DRE_02290 [Drechslerella stenobrocha 248]
MALRQLPRATCRNLHRPTLSLLSIYASSASSHRAAYHLIHLSNPDGLPDESDGHVVRLFTKESLQARAEEERKEKETRKKSKKAGGGGSVAGKEIQISWGIDSHDLTHRLERAGKFLEKGNRVELMIAKKKGQSKVTPERLQEVMDVIEEFMYYNGGASVRKQEGEVGAQIKMWLQRPADWVRPPPKVEGAEAAEGVVGEGMRAEGDAAGEGVVEEGGVGEVDGGQGEQQQQQQGHVPAWRSKSEVVW